MDTTMKMAAEWVMQVLDKGIDLMAAELPVFVGEVLLYYRAAYTAGSVLAIAAHIVVAGIIYAAWKRERAEEAKVVASIVGGIGSVFGACFTICCVIETLKVWLAPRLFLIEWAGKVLS